MARANGTSVRAGWCPTAEGVERWTNEVHLDTHLTTSGAYFLVNDHRFESLAASSVPLDDRNQSDAVDHEPHLNPPILPQSRNRCCPSSRNLSTSDGNIDVSLRRYPTEATNS